VLVNAVAASGSISEHSSTPSQTLSDGAPMFEFIINSDWSLSLDVGAPLLIGILILLLIALVVIKIDFQNFGAMEIDEAEFGIGNQKIKLKPNDIDSHIAYKIWVELSTRKIGLPVDLESDVLTEIYDSWYQFFAVTRELIKEIPASKLKRKDTIGIIELSIDVLNRGVRPHLTIWQAKFRRWYEAELSKKDNLDRTPQDIQNAFPQFKELSDNLLTVNKNLIGYRKKMRELAFGRNVYTRGD